MRAEFPTKGKPGWPSPKLRYCTAHCKVNPIDKVIRNEWSFKGSARILSVTGERREESPHRAKLPEIQPDKRLTAGRRRATWLMIAAMNACLAQSVCSLKTMTSAMAPTRDLILLTITSASNASSVLP